MAEEAVKDVEMSENRAEFDSVEDESSGSSSSDSEPDEETEKLLITSLEKTLQESPSNYEVHVQYIQCLRRFCHTEKLRQARKSMSELFPLSPEMWRDWAKDEITLNPSSEAVPTIEEIYEKGVHEYLSVPLWLDYLHFIEEHDQSVAQCSPDGISKMRNLYERAISSAGLHMVQGSQIWDAYREFEEAILLTIEDTDNEAKAKQTSRVRALYHRQLSVPLANMESTFLTYKQWEIGLRNTCEDTRDLDVTPKSVASAYQKALEMYKARISYEDQLFTLNSPDSDRLQQFMSYIRFEDSSGNPARVQTLYERAVSEFPISGDIWLDYTTYMDKTLKIPSVLKDVYSRATRNCSWICSLWVQYLLSLERVGSSEKELLAVFEQSLLCSFPSFNEYLDLFLTRIDGLRRRISSHVRECDGLDYNIIRGTFKRASEYLPLEGIGLEDSLHLYDYWARLEMELGNDLKAARDVWESLLKKSGTIFEFWKGYLDMEIRLGKTNEARSIYKRCYSKKLSGNGSEDICHSWLRFERQFGSLDDFDLATKKVNPRLKELGIFRMQEATKSIVESTAIKSTVKSAVQNDGVASKTSAKKRKMRDLSVDKQLPAKKQKDVIPDVAESKVPVDDGEKSKTSVDQTPGKSPFYTDQCTVFVSNLSLEVNDGHLREFFGDVGGVTAIRLVKDKFTGKPKGFAYVDFSDDEHLNLAIAKNREILQGKKLSIARSDPKQVRKKGIPRGGFAGGRGGRGTSSDDQERKSTSSRRVGHVQLSGSATFAVPRSVRPLGWSAGAGGPSGGGEGQPKSNEEFRNLIGKK